MIATRIQSLGKEIGLELRRIGMGAICILIGVLLFVLIVKALPDTSNVYGLATILIVLAALGVAAGLTYLWNRPVIAWVLSWLVVPGYLYIGGLLIPGPPNKFEAIAYIFGTFYGIVAGAIGVGLGLLIRRKQRAS
jgi:hypothetical protein